MNSLSLYSSENKLTLLRCFFWFFILEACLGGSGQLIAFGGGLSIRKINFTLALLMSFFIIFYLKKISKDIAFIFISFTVSLLIAVITGFINYGRDERVIENLLMQSFLLLLPFYSLFIKNEADIGIVISILKFTSLLMAFIYLIVIGLLVAGVLDFVTVHAIIDGSVEFMGRGQSGFWYKGFLYLCIGLFFFDMEKNAFPKRLKQILIAIAIYFTFTRGFILALFVTIILHQLFFKSVFKSMLILFFSILVITFFGKNYEASSFDRSDSDNIRKIQFHQVIAAVDPTSIFIGHGFGKGVPIRENHFEINYLEIFHKQGTIGIIFWFSLLGYIFFLYNDCRRSGCEKKARPFFLAALFVYIQSATNPFLTNSIGLNMIMISIVCLNIYITDGRESINSNSNI